MKTEIISLVRRIASILLCVVAASSAPAQTGFHIHDKPARTTPVSSDLFLIENPADGTLWKLRFDQLAVSSGGTFPNTLSLFKGNNTGGAVAAVANKDFDISSEQVATNADVAWTSGKTTFTESAALTANRSTALPPANAYAPGTVLWYIDSLTTGNFGRAFSRSGTDTLNGATAAVTPFRAGGLNGVSVAKFKTNGSNAWQQIDTIGRVLYAQDQIDPTKQIGFDATGLPTNTTAKIRATVDGAVAVAPNTGDPADGTFVYDYDADGQALRAAPPVPTTINEYVIGDADDTVPNISGSAAINLVTLNTPLTAMRTITFPDAALYTGADKRIFLQDLTGSLTTTNFLRIVSANGNVFNGNNQIDITRAFFNRAFVADPVGGDWSIDLGTTTSTGSTSTITPWQTVNLSGGAYTLNCTNGYNFVVNLTATAPISITNAANGGSGRIKFRQDATGSRAVTLPAGSKSPANGLGTIALSTSANSEDEFTVDFDGTNYNWTGFGLNYTAAAPATYSTVSDDRMTTPTATAVLQQGLLGTSGGAVTSNEIAMRLIDDSSITNGSTHPIGKVRLALLRNGSPNYNVYVRIRADNGSLQPAGVIGTASPAIAASSLATGAVANQDFSPNAPGIIGARNVTSVTTTSTSSSITAAAGSFLSGDVGCYVFGTGLPSTGTAAKITAVAANGSSATMNVAATASGTITATVKHVYWVCYYGDGTATSRIVTDVSATGTTTLTASGTTTFTSADVGVLVSGSGISSNTTIASVTDTTHAVLSSSATVTAGTSVTINGPTTGLSYGTITTTGTAATYRSAAGTAWGGYTVTQQGRFITYK